MPRDESPVGDVRLVLTCEHASARLPAGYGTLGLPASVLRSHLAHDLGARTVARRLARTLHCPYFEGRYSRLLVDLNRSESHPRLVPKAAGKLRIIANERMPRVERERRIREYWRPHRSAAQAKILDCSVAPGLCLHVAVHSFTPVLNGRRRGCDVGILYDPKRPRERLAAGRLCGALRHAGASVRLNYPYRGTADGFTTALRRRLSPARYVGLEIELNQSLLTRQRRNRRRVVVAALEAALRALAGPLPAAECGFGTMEKTSMNSWERLRNRAISD